MERQESRKFRWLIKPVMEVGEASLTMEEFFLMAFQDSWALDSQRTVIACDARKNGKIEFAKERVMEGTHYVWNINDV